MYLTSKPTRRISSNFELLLKKIFFPLYLELQINFDFEFKKNYSAANVLRSYFFLTWFTSDVISYPNPTVSLKWNHLAVEGLGTRLHLTIANMYSIAKTLIFKKHGHERWRPTAFLANDRTDTW